MYTKLTISKNPSDEQWYMAEYEDDEALNLAYQGTLSEAIDEALAVWGLQESEVYIEASN